MKQITPEVRALCSKVDEIDRSNIAIIGAVSIAACFITVGLFVSIFNVLVTYGIYFLGAVFGIGYELFRYQQESKEKYFSKEEKI